MWRVSEIHLTPNEVQGPLEKQGEGQSKRLGFRQKPDDIVDILAGLLERVAEDECCRAEFQQKTGVNTSPGWLE